MLDGKKSAFLAGILYTLIFVVHYRVAKDVLEVVSPYSLAWLRGWCGGALLVVIFSRRIRFAFSWRLVPTLLLLSLLGFGLNQYLFLEGLSLSHTSHAALIMNSLPIVTLALAAVFGQESLKASKVLGMAIAFSSLALLFIWHDSFAAGSRLKGDALILASVVCLASFFLLSKSMLRNIPAEAVSIILLLVGGTYFAFLSGFSLAPFLDYAMASTGHALRILFELVFSTALAYYLNMLALRRLRASSVAALAFLQVPLTSLLDFAIAGRMPETLEYLVFLGILIGAVLIYKDEWGRNGA